MWYIETTYFSSRHTAVTTSLVGRTCSFLLFELYFMWFNCSVYLHGKDRALILLQKNKRINKRLEWQKSKMPFRQYHTAGFWSPRVIWKLPHSRTQVMTGFILKDEVMLLSLISVSCQATLLYLWRCLHFSIFGLKMEPFPESSHFLASLNLPIWCYRKGTSIFSWNNTKILSVFPPLPVGSSWPRWDFSWNNFSAVAPVSFKRCKPRGSFSISPYSQPRLLEASQKPC